MSFWYPDNTERRDRVDQLSNDITVMQQLVGEAKTAMDKADSRMVPYFDLILKNNGLQTWTQLQQKLSDALPPDQKKLYDDLIKRSEMVSNTADNALMATSAIMLMSGVLSKTIDIGNFLRAGHVIMTFRSYGRAFVTLVKEGIVAGKAAFKAAGEASDLAVAALEDASKLAKYASTASRLLKIVAVIGVIADAFILALALYEEGQQRDALRDAINQLYVSRIIAKFYARMCDSIKTQDGMMISYLLFISDSPVDPIDQSAADRIAGRIVSYVTEDWKGITASSSLDLLVLMDKQRGSWTNEDPSYQDAIDTAEKNQDLKPASALAVKPSSITTSAKLLYVARQSKAHFEPLPSSFLMQSVVHVQDLTKAHLRAVMDL